ncbi:ECs1072 family phage-associated protein [Serratia sp. BNK-4]|uniref:ECs1072 family phage-associated protein n=1 Tax=Serratia sp. BNK-4 TaxID=3376141 RepID=UPI003B428D1D
MVLWYRCYACCYPLSKGLRRNPTNHKGMKMEERYKNLFDTIIEHVAKIHHIEKEPTQYDKLRLAHRAFFYFKLEVMLHSYRNTLSDEWGLLNGINAAYHLISVKLNTPLTSVVNLSPQQVMFILADEVQSFKLPQKAIEEITYPYLARLQGQEIQQPPLDWNLDGEWPLGAAEKALYSEKKQFRIVP